MSQKGPSGALAGLYEERIGTPTTDDEVRGYWLFAVGVLLGALGVVVFAATAPRTGARSIGYALVALSPPLAMLGAIVRFPLRRSATLLGALGGLLTLLAVVYFLLVFPDGWSTSSGNLVVNGLYAAGIVCIGLAGAIVPLVTDPVREDYERMQAESAAATATAADTADELEATREDLEATRDDLTTAREERSDAEERAEELDAELSAARATIESLRSSKARFELFEDRAGKARWRLRHRNGNVIATAGQGYSSRGKARQGLHSVRRNALGAGLLRIETEPEAADEVADDEGPVPEDAADPDVAVPIPDAPPESRATFELFEDAGGEWRWRLRHDNGNVIGDSGEGYASKSNAKRALSRVREHVAAADYLRVDPAAFEVFRDAAGEYRWRLVHQNGNVIADSGEGYASRSKARQGLDSVRSNAGGAGVESPDEPDADPIDGDDASKATFELYEDAAGEYRWRLVHQNGNVIADSGEGYASKSNGRDAIERVREYGPDADVLEVGNAAFEIYEDAGGEWRWRLRHRNGNVLGDSGEGYASRSNAVEAVTGVKRNAPGADAAEVEA
ncbi:DUF1508 domain-containing protein [Halorubrum sp. CBA1125]|uniref:HVO_2922 family protein n=1 Tax=Halorubrum sp. CBA1125 TaxID=2668072 RepID=UPI0012E77D2A|nr:HVO_2922 family protein [Halorubrum sp. CBA1125]MUW13704.1 DUF1508 domain-containing protein [Halorubrum sp. CBA1125]